MEQPELVKFIVGMLDELGVPYAVVGSYASAAYGEPRFTQDVDIVVDLAPHDVDQLIARLPSDDFYVSREAALQAIRSGGQFNAIHPESGNKIDFMISPRDAWGRQQLGRRIRLELLPGFEAYIARPEDIIISKMLYYREGGSEKHLRDITGILKISGDQVDQQDVKKWADELGVSEIWEAILARLRH